MIILTIETLSGSTISRRDSEEIKAATIKTIKEITPKDFQIKEKANSNTSLKIRSRMSRKGRQLEVIQDIRATKRR